MTAGSGPVKGQSAPSSLILSPYPGTETKEYGLQDTYVKASSSSFLPGVSSAFTPCVVYVIFMEYTTQVIIVPLSQALGQSTKEQLSVTLLLTSLISEEREIRSQ